MLTIFSLTTCAFTVLDFNMVCVVAISFVLIIKTFCLKKNNKHYIYIYVCVKLFYKYYNFILTKHARY